MEMNLEKVEGNETLKAIPCRTDCDGPKTAGECGVTSTVWVT